MEKLCFNCRDSILNPIIYGKLKHRNRAVALDYGCANKLFEDGLLKISKVEKIQDKDK